MDDEHDESQDEFSEIVHHSLSDVDVRPLRMKILDWALVVGMITGIGLVLAILLGFCAWVWSIVIGKF